MNELLRRSRIIIADGGMGTQLQAAGLMPGECGELWNIERPDAVRAIHRAYADAGAEILLTNTFGASAIALERHGLRARAKEINTAAAGLAVDAFSQLPNAECPPSQPWILGDIGPFGGFMEPLGETPRDVVFNAFREQAEALLRGFVDGIIIETMSSLDEVEVAVEAARAAGALLIAASVSFEQTRVGIRTMMGDTPRQAAERLTALHVDILGTNCGTRIDPAGYAQIVSDYRGVNAVAPVFVKMNAGSPRLEGERTVYDATPEIFAEAVSALIEAGADIIGGCCGSSPAHIKALSSRLAPTS